MKTFLLILLLIILSCSRPVKLEYHNLHPDTTTDAAAAGRNNHSKYYTLKDTLLIATAAGDTLKYSKMNFNTIIDNHPELYSDFVQDPEQTYLFASDKNGFNSEVGQDEYYNIYAYFLKQKNGLDKHAERRKKLISVYSGINSLYHHFEHGGTYFGHQASRIAGYTEYSVYLYNYFEQRPSKTYDIGAQKKLYTQSLRQLIDDELHVDWATSEQDKARSRLEMNAIVDNIEKTISDNFYLRRAQEFQYEHYQYY